MGLIKKILRLTKRNYPKGRAFNLASDSNILKTHSALGNSEVAAINSATEILFSILPDNENFTTEDATRWEQRLGLITNPAVSLVDRKLAIIRKMNHPGDIPARQSGGYLENQLRASGFDVYVHANTLGQAPADIFSPDCIGIWETSENCEHGEIEHGQVMTGSIWQNTVANFIDEQKDEYFNVGGFLFYIFYIGGENLGDFASVPSARKNEFRQLILKLKPAHTVGMLFINYD